MNHRTNSLLAATLVLALAHSPLNGQSASVTYYGNTVCSGSPAFSVSGLPRLGSTIRVITDPSVRYPTGSSQNSLLLGLSDQNAGGVKLPFDLSSLTFLWCGLLLNSNEVWVSVPTGTSPMTMPFTVPNDPRILGASVYVQALRKRTGLIGVEHFLSRGAKLTIGR